MAVFIDLKSAFDVIWHKGLIYKMHLLGFNPIIIRITTNYLKDRCSIVKINNSYSDKKKLVTGFCQDTILAATYFIIYMNDFPKINDNPIVEINRLLYADDILIFTFTKNIIHARAIMNKYLKKIYEYLENWKQKINIDKCEAISIVGHYKDLKSNVRKGPKEISFKMNNVTIQNKNDVKYLGVTFTRNFQFIRTTKKDIHQQNNK